MKAEPLRLYGFVGPAMLGADGDGFSAASVATELDKRSDADRLDVYLSSGGGNVTEGLAIYAQIKRFAGDVTVYVDGVAASIASLIALAGTRLVMPPSAMLMIHRPWAGAIVAGNSPQLREQMKKIGKMADDLDVMNDTMRGLYVAASRMSPAAMQKMMDDETWLTAEKAKELGFAEAVRHAPGPAREGTKAAASLRPDLDLLNLYRNTPGGLRTMRAEAAIDRLEGLLARQRVSDTAKGASAAAVRIAPLTK